MTRARAASSAFASWRCAVLAACWVALLASSPVVRGAPVAPDPALDAVVASLVGDWDNRAQYDAAPAALKVPPTVEGEWLDLQHARFFEVVAPALGSHVVYLEWRRGGPDGEI